MWKLTNLSDRQIAVRVTNDGKTIFINSKQSVLIDNLVRDFSLVLDAHRNILSCVRATQEEISNVKNGNLIQHKLNEESEHSNLSEPVIIYLTVEDNGKDLKIVSEEDITNLEWHCDHDGLSVNDGWIIVNELPYNDVTLKANSNDNSKLFMLKLTPKDFAVNEINKMKLQVVTELLSRGLEEDHKDVEWVKSCKRIDWLRNSARKWDIQV